MADHEASLPYAVQSIRVSPDAVFSYTNEIARNWPGSFCMVGALRFSWPADFAVYENHTDA